MNNRRYNEMLLILRKFLIFPENLQQGVHFFAERVRFGELKMCEDLLSLKHNNDIKLKELFNKTFYAMGYFPILTEMHLITF